MNLYTPNPLLDSPYGPSDLEWLYRQQDVDGATLTSRLSQLAPVSFTNTIDGQRRRRLFALDTWETEQLRLDQRQPRGAFANNAGSALANPSPPVRSIPTPAATPSRHVANTGFTSLSTISAT